MHPPSSSLNRPAAHTAQAVLFVTNSVPAPHVEHALSPIRSVYSLAADSHALHAASSSLKKPAGQSTHAVLPAFTSVPAPHCTHAALPLLAAYHSAGQPLQCLPSSSRYAWPRNSPVEYVALGQSAHPASSLLKPAGHAAHTNSSELLLRPTTVTLARHQGMPASAYASQVVSFPISQWCASRHATLAAPGAYHPSSHSTHARSASGSPPTSTLNQFAGHAVHRAWPRAASAASRASYPSPQCRHAVRAPPGATHPSAHCAHAVSGSALYWPSAHTLQAVLVVANSVPAPHVEHALSPMPLVYVMSSASHASHAHSSSLKKPAGHVTHPSLSAFTS